MNYVDLYGRPPPNTTALGTGLKTAYWETAVKGVIIYITKKNIFVT